MSLQGGSAKMTTSICIFSSGEAALWLRRSGYQVFLFKLSLGFTRNYKLWLISDWVSFDTLADFDRRAEETKKHYERILAAEKDNLQQQFDIERENIHQMSEKFSEGQKENFQSNIKQLEQMIDSLRKEHLRQRSLK